MHMQKEYSSAGDNATGEVSNEATSVDETAISDKKN